MRGAQAPRCIVALALAALAGCTSASATQGIPHRLTVNEIISGKGTDDSSQFEVTGRLYPVALRSVFLTDAAFELPEGERVPPPDECVQVATTEAQSRAIKRYEGQIVTLVGSIVRVPIASDRIVVTLTLEGKQPLLLNCQYPFDGGVVPIIDLESWKRP